jgi:sensor c-di-GMP phosphodiesterase-like protein
MTLQNWRRLNRTRNAGHDGAAAVVTASVGSRSTRTTARNETLLKNAGEAMSSAKSGTQHALRVRSCRSQTAAIFSGSSDLRRAIEANELLHFQPKFDLRSGALTGAEVLVRWQHHARLIAPEHSFQSRRQPD